MSAIFLCIQVVAFLLMREEPHDNLNQFVDYNQNVEETVNEASSLLNVNESISSNFTTETNSLGVR
jgi:hypothetical protein